MALAALWVLPVAFAIVGFSAKIQENLNQKAMDVKMVCADGIQECIETVRDLKANNAEQAYLKGLEKKIRAVEHRSILNEFGLAVFVVSASLVLKLGIATVALVGAVLLMQGSLSVLTFFMFLLVVSRLYDPLQGALQNLAAVISTRTNIARMNEILDHPIQQGSDRLSNQGYDIVFDHVGFAYNTGETVLKDVSFTAKQGEVTALVGPSGGGKTTVSRLAARFWDINRGKITVGGMDVSRIDPETLLSLYSIVFQRMLHCLTIRFWKISESETKTPQMNRSLLLRNLPMWMNLQKNYQMDGIPISGKMAVNFPAESASVSLLPVHF